MIEQMSDLRIMPEPHRYAVCAREDMPIKDFNYKRKPNSEEFLIERKSLK